MPVVLVETEKCVMKSEFGIAQRKINRIQLRPFITRQFVCSQGIYLGGGFLPCR